MDGRKPLLAGLAAACLIATGCVTTRGETEHNAKTIVAFADMQAAGGFSGDQTPEVLARYRHEAQLGYLEAIKKEPRYQPAYLGLARLQMATGDTVAGMGTYQQALQLGDKNAGLWHEVGMAQCKLKQWDAGVASLRKALEFDPNSVPYSAALGFALVMGGKRDEGFAMMVKLGGEAKAHRDMAKLMAHQGDSDGAKFHLAEAAKLAPPKPLEEAPREDVRQVGYGTPGAAPTIIQAGVVQGAEPRRLPIPPTPVLSIRGQ